MMQKTYPWNRVRFVPEARRGHVESFFIIAQDPTGNRALWIKATILALRGSDRKVEASAWLAGVERTGSVWALKETVDWCDGSKSCSRAVALTVAGLTLGTDRVVGTVCTGGRDEIRARLDLALQVEDAGRIALLFSDALYELPWPAFKLVTPVPRLAMTGQVSALGRDWKIDRWTGMQGHNWGRRHAPRYGWVFCNTWDGPCDDDLVVEGFSLPRDGVSGGLSGGLAGALVSYEGRQMHFNGPFQLLKNRFWNSDLAWGIRADGRDGRLTLRVWARPERTVCLRYRNPDGTEIFCANSPLASAELLLEMPDGRSVVRRSTTAVLESAGPSVVSGLDVLA